MGDDELQVDMNKLGEMLDAALTSDDPIVKDQLRKLLTIVALTARPDSVARRGPFAQMQKDIKELQDAMREVASTVKTFRGRHEYDDRYEEAMMKKMSQTASDSQIAKSQWLKDSFDQSTASFKDIFENFHKKGI